MVASERWTADFEVRHQAGRARAEQRLSVGKD